MLLSSEVFDVDALTSLIASATLLGADLKAGLFTNDFTPSKLSVIGDFTEPTYASYARQVVVMGAPYRDPANGIAALAAALTWQMTGTPTPCIVRGIFYLTGAGPILLGAEKFAVPIPLNDVLDAFDSVLEYIQSSQGQGFTTIIQ